MYLLDVSTCISGTIGTTLALTGLMMALHGDGRRLIALWSTQ